MMEGRGKVTAYTYGAFGKLIETVNSENQSIYYQYDMAGNLAQEIDRSGNHILYTFDSRNMLTQKEVQETGETIAYSYDAIGNRQTMTDESGETSYVYDANNRLTEKRKDGVIDIAYSYDAVGNITAVTDNKGFTTAYTYDKASRMKTVSFDGRTATYEYDENGNRKSIEYPGGIKEEYVLNKNNRLVSLLNKRGDGSIISKYDYTYDLTDKKISKTDSYGTTSYIYDPVGRIKTVEAPGKTTHYSYDRAGNRLTMEEIYTSPQPSGYIDVVTGEAVQYKIKKSDYVYTNANKLIKLVEKLQTENGEDVLQKTTSYQYDANGNEVRQAVSYIQPHNRQMRQSTTGDIHGDSQTEEINYLVEKVNSKYDGFNRLKEIEKIKDGERAITTFIYDGDGLRTQKTSRSSRDNYQPVTTGYHYDRQHVIQETDEAGAVKARYIRGNNYIGRYDSNNQLVYYLYNGHGDVVQTVTQAGEVQNQYDYDIFGNPTLQIEQHENAIRYAGEFYDSETGLYYLRARYYNPYTGRFVSEDSYWGEETNPLSLNRYTYGHNDPIKYVDPTGHAVTDWDKANLSSSQIKEIEKLTRLWDLANSAGNQAIKDQAHQQAEAIRNTKRADDEVGTGDGHTVKKSSSGNNTKETKETSTLEQFYANLYDHSQLLAMNDSGVISDVGSYTLKNMPAKLDLNLYAKYKDLAGYSFKIMQGPTVMEGAIIADHVYYKDFDQARKDKLEGGWQLVDAYEEGSLRIGVYARKGASGETEYVLANQGTTPTDLEDWKNNILQPLGMSQDVENSLNYSRTFVERNPNANITFVGHSKGGAEAAANAIQTNRNAILFNPATVVPSAYDLDSSEYTAEMTAYIVEGEALNNIFGAVSEPIGEVVYLPKQYSFEASSPELNKIINIGTSVMNHGMKAVIKGLKELERKNK